MRHGIPVTQTSLKERDKREEALSVPELSVPETLHNLWREQLLQAEKELKEQGRAKYKLEILFTHKHHVNNTPTVGTVSFWEGAAAMGGTADAKVYVCSPAGEQLNGETAGKHRCCGKLVPDHCDMSDGSGRIVCPHCSHVWRRQDLVGEVTYNLMLSSWVLVVIDWFQRMSMLADIVMKYHRDDIRVVAAMEQERQRGGELLNRARSSTRRMEAIYPLSNIIRDTSNGTTLDKCIRAFLRS